MKAVVYTQYGPPEVLHLAEVEKPAPKAHEVLVRIHAVNVNFGDLIARQFNGESKIPFRMPGILGFAARMGFGWSKPKRTILGNEYAGVVEAVGPGVTRFKAGDRVFAYPGQNMGAYAEYACIAEDGLVARMPANVSFVEAAAVPYGALTALSLLRKVQIGAGTKVLIVGASGSIGAAALQLAKDQGAEVTAVCGTERVAMVKALGADHVIDYTREDFTQGKERYDVVFDVYGRHPIAAVLGVLKPEGRYLLASFQSRHLLRMLAGAGSKQKVICALSNNGAGDMEQIAALMEAGKLKSFVDRCYPLEQAAAAHRTMEAGARRGAIVLEAA